jgi:hypothetical protein
MSTQSPPVSDIGVDAASQEPLAEIEGSPRQDRHPYLQLDADVNKRSVVVSEGDVWQGRGGNRSRKVGEWRLSEITATLVTERALAIVRRSVREPAT